VRASRINIAVVNHSIIFVATNFVAQMATVVCPRDKYIDSEPVINEVEKRPALFNKNGKEYSEAK
jgi:hypothetical protein